MQDLKLLQELFSPNAYYHVYESMLVEVKGPGDMLAPNQLMWQRVLTAVNTDGACNNECRVCVGYVKEK